MQGRLQLIAELLQLFHRKLLQHVLDLLVRKDGKAMRHDRLYVASTA
jgi:hypothetical protein